MSTEQEINEALEICAAASKGPAVWAADRDDTEETATARFLAHYRLARQATGSSVLHQVDLDAGDGDGAFCFAVTGNGPNGAPNAKFIAAALHPRLGYEACLRGILALQAANAMLEAEIKQLRAALQHGGEHGPQA